MSTPVRAAATLLGACATSFAQCAMCRTAMAAQQAKAIGAFNHAILILLVPAVALFSGMFLWAIRFRNEVPPGEESGALDVNDEAESSCRNR